ncbi:MAG TPA: MYXO-CTERM sorting domain-containing protein [Kofleriaceae bacterium]|nr:MYXO-CTERM sorting domain-containing protein [Kofleriaceae bacterium]
MSEGRLRRTNEEQTTEMPSFVMLDDGTGKLTKGLYFLMRTELPPETAGGPNRPAPDRVQLAVVPFSLGQASDGSVIATADASKSFFATNNDGNEYRNANLPQAFALTKDIACVNYNYQQNGTNDTKRYTQCFTADGTRVLNQSLIMANTNDDCSQHASGDEGQVTQRVGDKVYFVMWAGCNGNGDDAGFVNFLEYDVSNPTAVTVKRQFNALVAEREERTRGNCSIAAKDPNTAICTWSEGNNQPTMDGTWMAAIDITPGKFSGTKQQGAIIWKEMVDGRKDKDGIRTYSMRAHHVRIQAPNAQGALENTDMMLWYSNDLQGNNANDGRKGGTVRATQMGIIKADREGMSFVMPLRDTSQLIRGTGGSHLGMTGAVFGTTDKLLPGAMFTVGSFTGGYFSGQARSLVWDQAAGTFKDGGMIPTAENDAHLYSNYLGNNPGNQGRNFDDGQMISNPFLGVNGNTDAYLMVYASTGKPMSEVGVPEKKPSAFLTVIPLASAPAPVDTGSGSGSSGSGSDEGSNGDNGGAESLGGCSAGGTSGLATLFLIGLAAFIRRRR